MLFSAPLATPIGNLNIEAKADVVTKIVFSEQPVVSNPNRLTDLAAAQLTAYFNKELTRFDLPLAVVGTPFQQQIWRLLAEISFGKTLTYLQLAEMFGDVKAIRAVAAANAKNQFAIVVPCHRVVGANNKLTGYAWGLTRKEWLLTLEGSLEQKLF